jgi:hypothetical protein
VVAELGGKPTGPEPLYPQCLVEDLSHRVEERPPLVVVEPDEGRVRR